MTDLKPCPFCGCSIHIERIEFVWCAVHDDLMSIPNCPIQVLELYDWGESITEQEAIALWNKRVME